MIDKVELVKIIKLNPKSLDERIWHKSPTEYRKRETGEIVTGTGYTYNQGNVELHYQVESSRLKIDGRPINLSQLKNRVDNLDDLFMGVTGTRLYEVTRLEDGEIHVESYEGEKTEGDAEGREILQENYQQDLEDLINYINSKLYNLTGEKLDVRTFKVKSIEFCVNLHLQNHQLVERCIELFNKIFIYKDDPRYLNYTIEQKKPLYSSCYIKSKKQYEDNNKHTYTMNFYNKLDQLRNVSKNPKEHKSVVTREDFEKAEDVLRLEVKANFGLLKDLCNEYGIDNRTRPFGDFLDIDMCYEIIKKKYQHFFGKGELDFYSYSKAKEKIQQCQLSNSRKKNLIKYISNLAKQQARATAKAIKSDGHNRTLAELGIHYYLIPTKWEIDFMESPVKLLDKKLDEVKRKKELFEHNRPVDDDWM